METCQFSFFHILIIEGTVNMWKYVSWVWWHKVACDLKSICFITFRWILQLLEAFVVFLFNYYFWYVFLDCSSSLLYWRSSIYLAEALWGMSVAFVCYIIKLVSGLLYSLVPPYKAPILAFFITYLYMYM